MNFEGSKKTNKYWKKTVSTLCTGFQYMHISLWNVNKLSGVLMDWYIIDIHKNPVSKWLTILNIFSRVNLTIIIFNFSTNIKYLLSAPDKSKCKLLADLIKIYGHDPRPIWFSKNQYFYIHFQSSIFNFAISKYDKCSEFQVLPYIIYQISSII